jgi:hypothetical protein
MLVGGWEGAEGEMDGLMKVASANQIHHENLQTAFYDISTEIRNESMRRRQQRRMSGAEKTGSEDEASESTFALTELLRKFVCELIKSASCLCLAVRARVGNGESLLSILGALYRFSENHHENPEKHLLRDVSEQGDRGKAR